MLPWIRAGALTAGVATFCALWWTGFDRLGYLEWPNGFDATFVVSILASVALGATLGHREPAPLALLLGRALLAFVVGCALGALLLGLAFALGKFLHMGERRLPPVYLALAIALCAWGLRRLPPQPAVRVALLVLLLPLVAVRLLAVWPPAAHAVERRIFPLGDGRIRAAWEERGCGSLCQDNRARVIDFGRSLSYRTDDTYLGATARVRLVLETARDFAVDGCGQAHAAAPEVPPSLRQYPDTAACIKATRRPRSHFRDARYDSGCCALENHPRHPGERFHSDAILHFVFHRLRWQFEADR